MYYSTIHSYGWIVLFCAVILGGYYTDYHGVDEDLTAISVCSGHHSFNTYAGTAYRSINDHPASTSPNVASVSTFTHYLHDYADNHNVDEDLKTISYLGGRWPHNTMAGVMYRDLDGSHNDSTATMEQVASERRHL